MSEQQPEAPAIPGVTRWRKKPVTVSAIEWTGANFAAVRDFAAGALGAGEVARGALPLWVVKSQALCHVQRGDWIIREVDGSGFYPCAADVFAATYEPASEPLVAPTDEPWTPEQLAEFQAHFDAAMANPGPLRVLPSDRWKDRAEAAEAALEHAKAALAGDHEGIRLWMLDCGELVAKHRARAEAAEAKLAAIAEHCRGHLERAGAERGSACCPHLAADILAITGSEDDGTAAIVGPSGGNWRESLDRAAAALSRVRELATAWVTPGEGGMGPDVTPRVGRRVLDMAGTGEGVMVKLEKLTRMAGSWIEPGGTFSWTEGGVRLLGAIKGGEVTAEDIRAAITGSDEEPRDG